MTVTTIMLGKNTNFFKHFLFIFHSAQASIVPHRRDQAAMVQMSQLLILLHLIPLLPQMQQLLSGPHSSLNPARQRVRDCTPARRWDAATAGDMVRMASMATHGVGMFAVRNGFAALLDSDSDGDSLESVNSDMSMSSLLSLSSISSVSSSSLSSLGDPWLDIDFAFISIVARLFQMLQTELARPNAGLRYAPPDVPPRTIAPLAWGMV